MRRAIGLSLWLFVVAGGAVAAEPQGKMIEEVWNAAYLAGGKAGFVHTTVHLLDRDGQKTLRTTLELNLTVRRFNDTVQLRSEIGTEETPAGKVTGVFMRHYLGQRQQLILTGTVDGDELHCKVEGGDRLDKRLRWNDEVVGLYRQERLYKEKEVKPGDTFTFLSFEPTLVALVTRRISVIAHEEVEVLGVKKRLLRVEEKTDKIQNVELPASISWLDEELRVERSQFEIPGLGPVVLYRSTAEKIRTAKGPLAAKDIGFSTVIQLGHSFPQPHKSIGAVYSIRVKGDEDPGSAFTQDERQSIKAIKGDTFELHVRAIRGPQPKANPAAAPAEFLQSCFFIKSDDAQVKALSRLAVGQEKDPWRMALRIEKWVYANMRKKNFSEAFATADEVARSREGDCTEHSMLAAAMCRAAAIPSRTALGLIYFNSPQGPAMAFHMWFEVWVQGQWLPLDATLGAGYVGAAHIKIADHSWHEVQSLTPILPVIRVLGKLSIEVVSVAHKDD